MKVKASTLQNLLVSPKEVKVRSFCDIDISFSVDFDIPKDSNIIFLLRGGRNNKNDWYFLQSDDPNQNGYINLLLPKPVKVLPMIITGKELLAKFLVINEEGILKGTEIRLKITNTLVQSLEEDGKRIDILIDLSTGTRIFFSNMPQFNVMHDVFDHVTIICPSTVEQNEEFKVLIRVEDKFKNLVKDFTGKLEFFKTDIQNKAHKREIFDINFEKDFKGIFWKEGIKLASKGQFFIKCVYQNEQYISNPIVCNEIKLQKRLYWGYIHGHSLKSDGVRQAREYYNNLLDAGLDFGTTTEHDHLWETSDEDFEDIKNLVREFTKDNEFISLFGYEWGTWYTGYGDICTYHKEDNIPILRSDVNKYNSIEKLNRNLKPYEENILLIAHHTALRPGYRNWDYFNNDLEKLVEIYSTWGNQEYPFSEGNPLPPRYKFFGYGEHARKRGAILEKKNCFVRDALMRGYKLGFTAGGDDHFGLYPSGSIDPDNGIYPPGIMAVWMDDLTDDSLWNALINRRCYGTTGPRVIIEFSLNEFFMGDIININEHPELLAERETKIRLWSPLEIEKVQLVRNNDIILDIHPNQWTEDLSHLDNTNLDLIYIDHSKESEKFVFYYIRIFLSENNMAWSSPIWIVKKN